MRKQRTGICLGILCLTLLLTACGETTVAPTALPTTTSASTPATAQIGATTVPASTSAATVSTPTVTPPPVATATLAPITSPTTAPTSTATPIPFQPVQRQIAPPNCCQDFRFASDGRLYFYDKPAGQAAATFTLDPNSGQRQQLTNRFGFFSRDLSLVAVSERASGQTTIEQVSDGKRLATLSNRANPTLISPDKTKLAYLLRLPNQAGPEAPQHFELWAGNLDGSNLRVVWNLTEGDNLAWFPDNRRLLLTARDSTDQRFGLWVVDTQAPPNQGANLIVESKGLIAASLSSDGSKVVYALTLQGEANSGIWLANTDGSQRRKFDWVGGWRWSPGNASELFYIPARASGETSSALWSYDTSTAKATRLTDPAALPFQFNLDEWQISPDSKTLAYRHASDNALWLLKFRP